MEVETEIYLKTCPFCGYNSAKMCKTSNFDFFYYVKCRTCGVTTRSSYTRQDAAEDWNRRTNG